MIGRESGSGTRDGFESITGTEDQCMLAQELSSTGAVIEAVRTTPGAIGYASLSAVQDQKGITVLTVGGVAPSEAHGPGRQLCHSASLRVRHPHR